MFTATKTASQLVLAVTIIFFFINNTCHAQGPANSYRQFSFNPYLFNPAYASISGRPEVNMALRKQWIDFRDAPFTAGFNAQIPVSKRVVLGANLITQSQVIVNSSIVDASFTYVVPVSSDQELRFGLAGGIGLNRLSLTADEMNTVDPVISNAVGTSYFPNASFGTVYSVNKLELGFALTNIFNNNQVSMAKFEGFRFSNLKNRLYSVRYRLDIPSDAQIEIEPYALYRESTDAVLSSWEIASLVHFRKVLSVGVSYNNKRGAGFLLGIDLEESLRLGYSYELPANGSAGAKTNAHEIQLGLRFSKPKR